MRRTHVEGFKLFFAAHLTVKGVPPARNTIRQRLGMLRSFFDRIIEWDWPDAPMRMPIFAVDVPIADDPLPRFLDDAQAARFAATAAVAVPFDRLLIELLSRTGMRVGELCTLAGDAVVVLNGTPWLRVPVGKLHNDRYVPLHPNAARLLTDWTVGHPPLDGRLLHRGGQHLNRHQVARIVRKIGRRAGLGHVHPHQLRHTLATQAINRGMRLEAIATMLGHRSLRMTLTYARIANKTVADEYATASAKIDALYTSTDPENRLKQLASRAPPDARQRLVQPTHRHRLRLRDDLRRLRLLRDHDRVPADPASPSRPRRPQPPNRTSSDLQAARSTASNVTPR